MKETMKKLAALTLAFFVGYAPVTWAAYRFTDTSNTRVGGIDNSGNADFDGTVTATGFSGDGSSLTNITADGIADNSVTSAKIADGEVGTADVEDGSLQTGDMAFDPIEETELDSLAELNTQLGTSIADGAHTVDTNTNANTQCAINQYLDGNGDCADVIEESEMDTLAELNTQVGASIADGAHTVDTAVTNLDSHDHDGGDGAQIPAGGIATGAVTTGKIATDAVDSSKVLNGSLTTADVAFDPIEETELDSLAELNTQLGTSIADGAHTTDTSAVTACAAGQFLEGDGSCTDVIEESELASLANLNTQLGTSIADGAHTTDTNTNAQTECAAGQFLEGDGSCTDVIEESELASLANLNTQLGTSIADGAHTTDTDTWADLLQVTNTTANICAATPSATPKLALSTDEFDIYSATGTAIGQWRNTRTGAGPC